MSSVKRVFQSAVRTYLQEQSDMSSVKRVFKLLCNYVSSAKCLQSAVRTYLQEQSDMFSSAACLQIALQLCLQ
jgi:metal-responsive CopG/Arc/MetJ family transcriptional regulator